MSIVIPRTPFECAVLRYIPLGLHGRNPSKVRLSFEGLALRALVEFDSMAVGEDVYSCVSATLGISL